MPKLRINAPKIFVAAALLATFIVLFAINLSTQRTPSTVDSHAIRGTYLGYGIGTKSSDLLYPRAFDELRPDFVRLEFGPDWSKIKEELPNSISVDDFRNFIARNYIGDGFPRLKNAQETQAFFEARDTKIIYILFELPYSWRTDDAASELREKHVEDLARFHTAHLMFLQEHGVRPDYIELANEPVGFWNGYIPPASYNRLVEYCAVLFQKHLQNPPKILGPGLTFLNLHGWSPAYFEALSRKSVEAIHGWSTHAWDEVEFTTSRPEFLFGVWQTFLDSVAPLDPDRKKPVFVTEYATEVLQFGDQVYQSPREAIRGNSVSSWPYAVRIIANSITHLNRGANALVLYRLSNSDWHDTGWGIISPETSPNFTTTPTYEVLRDFWSELPRNSQILHPQWYEHDDPITMATLLDQNQKLHLILTNATSETHTKTLQIPEHFGHIITSVGRDEAKRFSPKAKIERGSMKIELPPQSIARVVIQSR